MRLLAVLLLVLSFHPYLHAAEQLAPVCQEGYKPPSNNLVFVSTLDGQVTALDRLSGSELWTQQVGTSLLSSSIHRLELSNAGQWVRLVPSLSGTLYRFCGESLEPINLSVDQLLSSSYKFSDDLAIAGAKESSFIGVSTRTGRTVFQCSSKGCINSTDLSESKNYAWDGDNIEEEILRIHLTTQTVRAAEPRSGLEKWNFSVGHHDLILQPFKGCVLPGTTPTPVVELIYKVVVPEGIICAVQKNSPHNVVWKHKLSAPIVNAWYVEDSKIRNVDLFGVPYVPNSSEDMPIRPPPAITPTVYVGMHNRQLYIQESVRMQALVQALSKNYIDSAPHKQTSLVLPWRPYPAKVSFEWSSETTALTSFNEKEISTTALSVLYASEYINGNGYYLYMDDDYKSLDDPTCNTEIENNTDIANIESVLINNDIDDGFEWADSEHITVFVVSLWYWWKEVLVIAITSAVFLNVLSNKLRGRVPPREVIRREYVIVERVESVPAQINIPPTLSYQPDGLLTPFVSRYLTDFTPLKCLGRGGFGVVFEAKNKIDDCNYAVKRITLPNQSERREKVLREVRALAKLEHNNIVRYFNAWLEEPPSEWVDCLEKEFKSSFDFTGTYSKQPSASAMIENANKDTHDKNVCINMYSDSIDEGFDALDYDKYMSTSKKNTLTRQRSYSANDFVNIELDNNTSESATNCSNADVTSNTTANDIDPYKSNDHEHSSYIQFASQSETANDDNLNSKSTDHDSSKFKDNVICIDELSQKNTKRGHRRNFSLDSKKFNKSQGKIYLYIQMQLCRKESLREWLKENVDLEMRKTQYTSIFEQIVHAVEYVHLQGLIHRDLKPSNIFFSSEGQIKIGDFGLVTTMNDPFSNDSSKSTSNCHPSDNGSSKHTKHVGTHLYMSPEQLRGEAHNFKVDIWSLGLVLVELLIPFSTEMERVGVLKALRDHQFPKDFHVQYPDEHALLQLMLSPEPSKRPSTFGVRAHKPLLHRTDSQYHYRLPPRSTHSSTSSL
ncbi:pancreatic eIF-2alpha kinase [Arctopsyche grandis]|uniref:pancreatic eIF-2alpha kinase n=1 Tax=Arctopsyche grandis TaxID=121162 RepID=UPI00406D73D7